ncbi:MAG: hypothetical protein JRH20_20010 [Deltaproteobacteria bacterium]|nr:hypothetical protein [Deltaproteobacteria bacterium]
MRHRVEHGLADCPFVEGVNIPNEEPLLIVLLVVSRRNFLPEPVKKRKKPSSAINPHVLPSCGLASVQRDDQHRRQSTKARSGEYACGIIRDRSAECCPDHGSTNHQRFRGILNEVID